MPSIGLVLGKLCQGIANRLPVIDILRLQMILDRLRGPIPIDWNEQRQLFGFDLDGAR
jgi:hypothetical protein